ncbi:MAG TPA: VOC family protein [Vicinamibacterales bacterium]|nr:VOC family protein [Vicinamibacterales bacterium]
MSVKPIPDGYHSVTPYLIVRGATKAIDFYKEVFGATELMRMDAPGGKIGHAEIKVGDSTLMLADENPQWGSESPELLGGSPVQLMIYVDDCDATFKKAIATGAVEVRPLKDQFYGDRSGSVTDPFGHNWTIATHKEDLSPEEMGRRAAAEAAQAGG